MPYGRDMTRITLKREYTSFDGENIYKSSRITRLLKDITSSHHKIKGPMCYSIPNRDKWYEPLSTEYLPISGIFVRPVKKFGRFPSNKPYFQ